MAFHGHAISEMGLNELGSYAMSESKEDIVENLPHILERMCKLIPTQPDAPPADGPVNIVEHLRTIEMAAVERCQAAVRIALGGDKQSGHESLTIVGETIDNLRGIIRRLEHQRDSASSYTSPDDDLPF